MIGQTSMPMLLRMSRDRHVIDAKYYIRTRIIDFT